MESVSVTIENGLLKHSTNTGIYTKRSEGGSRMNNNFEYNDTEISPSRYAALIDYYIINHGGN